MAISTLDTLIAGMLPPQFFQKSSNATSASGVMTDYFRVRGIPGAGAAPAAGVAGATLVGPGVAGSFNIANPGAGFNYVGNLIASGTVSCNLLLVDRLWQNSGIVVTTTTAQTINSVAWPARDANGTTNGDGVHVGISVVAATTTANTTATISYTNQAGTAGRTGTILPGMTAACPINTFVPFDLQSGDFGVRSIQSITLNTSLTAGTISLVAYRPLVSVSSFAAAGDRDDFLSLGLPKVYDNSVMHLMTVNSAVTANTLTGQVCFAAG